MDESLDSDFQASHLLKSNQCTLSDTSRLLKVRNAKFYQICQLALDDCLNKSHSVRSSSARFIWDTSPQVKHFFMKHKRLYSVCFEMFGSRKLNAASSLVTNVFNWICQQEDDSFHYSTGATVGGGLGKNS